MDVGALASCKGNIAKLSVGVVTSMTAKFVESRDKYACGFRITTSKAFVQRLRSDMSVGRDESEDCRSLSSQRLAPKLQSGESHETRRDGPWLTLGWGLQRLRRPLSGLPPYFRHLFDSSHHQSFLLKTTLRCVLQREDADRMESHENHFGQ